MGLRPAPLVLFSATRPRISPARRKCGGDARGHGFESCAGTEPARQWVIPRPGFAAKGGSAAREAAVSNRASRAGSSPLGAAARASTPNALIEKPLHA
jgi:hypothetical protein